MFEKNAVLHGASCSVVPVGRVVSVFEKMLFQWAE